MDLQYENSDSDDDVPISELIRREAEKKVDNDCDQPIEPSLPPNDSNLDECMIHVYVTNDNGEENDSVSEFFIADENGNILCNNPSLKDELDNDLYTLVDGLPLDNFDTSLNDLIGSEVEISLETNDFSCFELPEENTQDVIEEDGSGSEYVPSTDNDSDFEYLPKKSENQIKHDKHRNHDEPCVHSYAKSPEYEKSKSRKRTRDPNKWKREITKRRRQHGLSYENEKGVMVPMKASKAISCRCKYRCTNKISNEQRDQIFRHYWSLSYEAQRSFISHHIKVINKKRRTKSTDESRRQLTYEYFLPLNDDMIQVCKSSFMNVLDVGPKVIEYTMKRDKIYDTKDRRGHHKKIEISKAARDSIRKHIDRFQRVDSHYCRGNTERQYLDKGLSVKKMYRMYVEDCDKNNIIPEKLWLYNSIFNKEFNLGFHHPKKDLCTFCEVYKSLDDAKKKDREKEFLEHQERKERIRHQKQCDIEKALEDNNTRVINFDLQKVLISPKTEIGEVYYSRKLATYNFTVFDIVSKQASCFMWYESVAKRGSNDISSCMYKYNKSLGAVDHIIYYSDSCSGQNRNLPFSCMCLYSVQNMPINTITHTYFERGHSQMEGDSVHATIEKATKKHDMFGPTDWMTAVSNCKVSEPRYKVLEVDTSDIKDFKDLADHTVSNRHKAPDGSTLQWTKVHVFEYRKSEPNRIYFKYDVNSSFNFIEIARPNLRRKMKTIEGYELKDAYESKICISKRKYDDLLSLCQRNIIPQRYHSFYSSLPHSESHESDEN